MQIDDTLITYLEDLSCLVLSDEEKIRLVGDLKEILGDMERLDDLHIEAVSTHSQQKNVFREDDLQASFDRDLILQNASRQNSGMFVVPKTIEEGR